MKITSYEDFVQILKTHQLNDTVVTQLTNGLVGWPIFKEVFAVSALNGGGVSELKNYILSSAKKGQWKYHPQLRTDKSPTDLVTDIIKSKCLEVMTDNTSIPKNLPYIIEPKISAWKVENGVLRLHVQVRFLSKFTTLASRITVYSRLFILGFFQIFLLNKK